MTFYKSLNRLIIGKCFLTQILTNRPKRFYFQGKNKMQVQPTMNFNNRQVERTSYQKHLGILFYEKLNFKQNIDNVIPKINKVISVIKNSDILYHGNHYLQYIKLS